MITTYFPVTWPRELGFISVQPSGQTMGNRSSIFTTLKMDRLLTSRYSFRTSNFLMIHSLIYSDQDHYKISLPSDSNPESFIEEKFRVTKAHLENAMDPELHPDQLYISFASAAFTLKEPSLTPQVIFSPIKREVIYIFTRFTPSGMGRRLSAWIRGFLLGWENILVEVKDWVLSVSPFSSWRSVIALLYWELQYLTSMMLPQDWWKKL